jgi:hypothetical protein
VATLEELSTRVRRILNAALPRGIWLDVRPRSAAAGPAFDVRVQAGAGEHRFLAGWAGEGWPADVEELLSLVPTVEVIVAASLSDGAKAWLDDKGVDWIDAAGGAAINRPSGLVVVREMATLVTRSAPHARWLPSTLAAAEAVLSGVVPTVERVEQATELSRNASAKALGSLERLGFLNRPEAVRGPKSGRRLVDADGLLEAYAKAAADQRVKQRRLLLHRLWVGDAISTLRTEISPSLNGSSHRWAVTGPAASLLLAPYLSDVTTLDLYVDADLISDGLALATMLGGRLVDTGHVIEVRQLPTKMSARGPLIDGVRVALPVRVYADLLAARGRSAEAANQLRETLSVGTAA